MPDRPPQRKTSLPYRPDVDGLRAVAVLLVVFDHLQTRVAGGYIGVDVFFVISGYLISSVILSEMAAGRFSLINFYERRVRRILPALLGMLLGCAAITCFCSVPSETADFARSLLSAVFSVSNFFFWLHTRSGFLNWHHAGYFDASRSGLDTLLHTWSLAVEEQFYIVFPLFLMMVRRWFPNRLAAAIWSITGFTFALACIWANRDPTAAFYFAPLRAWELLIGTIVSQHYVPVIGGKWGRNFAALAGLLLILVPSIRYTAATRFPGLAALPPCLGAALLLAAGETGTSLVGRLLSWRPFVFIGLISYSLYLWHWPLIIFLEENYIHLDYGSPKRLKMAVLVASLMIATVSWLFIERPFRTGRFRPGRRALFRITGAVASLTVVVGLFMAASDGLASMFPAEALEIDRNTMQDFNGAYRSNECFYDPRVSTFEQFNKSRCLSDDSLRRHALLVGDSHAAHLYPGLVAEFPEVNFSQATIAGCLPLLTQPLDRQSECDGKMWNYIYGDYIPHHRIDAVLMAGRWDDADIPELGRTILWLKQRGIKVILFSPTPGFDVPLPRLLTFSLRHRDLSLIDRHRKLESVETDIKLSVLAREKWDVSYISFYEDVCATNLNTEISAPLQAASGCPVYAEPGVPLLFDSNHFTVEGSVLYAKTIKARKQLP